MAKAFIFDMDNTLVQSRIDFPKMKKLAYEFLSKNRVLSPDIPWREKTTSQLVEMGRKHPGFVHIEKELWSIIEEVEAEGMRDAVLEPHAVHILDHLAEQAKTLTVLTNNAYPAAAAALKKLSIYHLFDLVAGREHMEELKPSPSGIYYILNRFPSIPKEEWIMVGDSWIDGMAAQKAGIQFLAYQGNRREMAEKGIHPIGSLDTLLKIKDWMT